MMSPRKRVLITGAAGQVGGLLTELLKDRYKLRLHYHRTIPEHPPSDDIVIADLTRFEQLGPAVEGVDAVVHMAADSSPWATWESVLERNIVGTRNVFEAARLVGVPKIVFGSSNHVTGMYDRDGQWPIYTSQPPRPDSLYGVSKAFGESLARYYVDRYGLSIICLRIGWCLPKPSDDIALWMWLSPRDCAQIVWRAIESSVRYGVFYAISNNSRRHWDITDATELLGYRPKDDAEGYAAEIEAAASGCTMDSRSSTSQASHYG